ncbi:MAG: c-type cytochrome [Chloroflexi bacterium]|nr:c-type cytochrome [Chloroflexota bacterium]
MKPIVDGLETQFSGQIAFQRINADEGDGPAIMRAYRIQGHPTILLINPQGQEMNRFIGPQTAEKLTEVLQQVLTSTAGQQVSAAASATIPLLPTLDAVEVTLGRQIYLEQCSVCHGQNAEGQPNWKQPDANGNMPAPPHDDTGHTWHHADGLLYEIIRDGFRDPLKPPDSPLTMPAFGDKLSDAEIRAVIAYFKSLWSEQSRLFQWQVTQQQPFPTVTPAGNE